MLSVSSTLVLCVAATTLAVHSNIRYLSLDQGSSPVVHPQKATIQTGLGSDREPLKFPGFTVEVTLSTKAKQKLIESKETILAIGYFTATPRKDVSPRQYRRFLSRPGPLGLGEAEVEANPGQRLKFGKIKLNRSVLALIDDQEPQLLINVVSGRRSSKDNLLDCDVYEGSLKSIQSKIIPITCKLTRE